MLVTLSYCRSEKRTLATAIIGMKWVFFLNRKQATENSSYLNTKPNICSILVTKQELIKLAKPGDWKVCEYRPLLIVNLMLLKMSDMLADFQHAYH